MASTFTRALQLIQVTCLASACLGEFIFSDCRAYIYPGVIFCLADVEVHTL